MASLAILLCLVFAAATAANEIDLQRSGSSTPFAKAAFGVAASPDGSRYAVAGREGRIVVYDGGTHQVVHSVQAGTMVLALAYSTDGRFAASVRLPGVIDIFRTDDWEHVRQMELDFRCGFLSFHPSLPLIAAGGAGPSVEIFDYLSGRKLRSLGEFTRTQGVLFTDNAQTLFVNATLGTSPQRRSELLRLDLQSSQRRAFPVQAKERQRLVRSTDGSRIGTVSTDGAVEVIELKSGRRQTWNVTQRLGQMAVFLPDNRTLVVGSGKGFHCYRLGSEDPVRIIPSEDAGSSYDAAFLPATGELLIAHVRPTEQLTRWRVVLAPTALPSENDQQPRQGFASASKPSRAATTMKQTLRNQQPATVNPPRPSSENVSQASPERSTSPAEPSGQSSTKPSSRSLLAMAFANRQWSSAAGSAIHASMIGFDEQKVLLRRADGTEQIVSRQSLSQPDRGLLDQVDSLRLERSPAIASDDKANNHEYEIVRLNRPLSAIDWRHSQTAPTPIEVEVDWIADIETDSFGRTWLASSAGLLTWRADRQLYLEAAGTSPSNPDLTKITRIAIDRFGRVVALTGHGEPHRPSGQAIRFDGTSWAFLGSPHGIPIEDIMLCGDEIIATGNFNGIAVLENDRWKVVQQRVLPGRAHTHAMLRLPTGEVLCKVKGKHPLRWDGRRLRSHPIAAIKPSVFSDDFPFDVLRDGSFVFMQIARSGHRTLTLQAAGTGKTLDVIEQRENADDDVYCFAIAADGAIWYSIRDGVFRQSGGQTQQISDRSAGNLIALASGDVWSLGTTKFVAVSEKEEREPSSDLYASFAPRLGPTKALATRQHDPMRVWTDRTGRFRISAKLLSAEAGRVTLQRDDGGSITIPLDQLSQRDRAFVLSRDVNPRGAVPDNDTFEIEEVEEHPFQSYGTASIELYARESPDRSIEKELTRIRRVHDIVCDGDDRVWLATQTGLIEYVQGEFYYRSRGPQTLLQASPQNFCSPRKLTLDTKGQLLVQFNADHGVYRWREPNYEQLETFRYNNKQAVIHSLIPIEGTLYASGGFPGIARYRNHQWTFDPTPEVGSPLLPKLASKIGTGAIVFQAHNQEQKLWLWKYKQHAFTELGTGLLPGKVQKIVGREGVVFAQMRDGMEHFVLRFDGNKQTTWTESNQSWGGSHVIDMTIASDGALWVVTSRSVARHDGKKWKTWPRDDQTVCKIYGLSNGEVWLVDSAIRIYRPG